MAVEPNPTVARRQLAVFFKNVRELQGHSLEALAERLGVALSQASRLDTGARGFHPKDVRLLASWYQLDAATEQSLLALAEESRKRAWWQQVDLKPAYRTLIGMEQVATSIDEYCGSAIPGLLQTRDFATAALRSGSLDVTPEQIGLAVDVRLRRQQILTHDLPPPLRVVIDEAALARVTGGSDVMRSQLEHLLEASTRPHITVQVIGFEYGIHPGGESQFILLAMPGDLPDVVYNDGLLGPSDSSAAAEVHKGRRLWQTISAIALDPPASTERIVRYLQQWAD
jgi:transcriptional regulator with XRE-family HTH domain